MPDRRYGVIGSPRGVKPDKKTVGLALAQIDATGARKSVIHTDAEDAEV